MRSLCKTPKDARGRVCALLMALVLAATATTASPLPALAETGGDTALCVERRDGGERTPDGTQQQQQSATVTSAKPTSGASPQTGDPTLAPVTLAAAGACAALAGTMARKGKASHAPRARAGRARDTQAKAPCHGA